MPVHATNTNQPRPESTPIIDPSDGLSKSEVETYAGLNQNEQIALFRELLAKARNSGEREELAQEFREAFAKSRKDYERQFTKLQRQIDRHINGRSRKKDDGFNVSDAQDLASELEKIIESIGDAGKADGTIDDVNEELAKENVDATDGKAVILTNDSFDPASGRDYTYTLGGSPSYNPFTTPGTQSSPEAKTKLAQDLQITDADVEYLKKEGVIDAQGTVKRNVDANTEILNYDDILQALKDKKEQDGSGEQIVELRVSTSLHLLEYDPATETMIFQAGNSRLIFKGRAKFKIFGGLNETEMRDMDGRYPQLLKRFYLGSDDSQSIHAQLNPDQAPQVDNKTRLMAIKGYQKTHNDVLAAIMPYGMTNPVYVNHIPKLEAEAKKIIDKLYSLLDDPSKTIDQIWDEIFNEINPERVPSFGPQPGNVLLIDTIVTAIAKNDRERFETFFTPTIVARLKPVLTQQGAGAFAYAVQLLLETKGGKDEQTVFAKYFAKALPDGSYEKGEWKDHANNVAILDLYKTLAQTLFGITSSAEANAAKTREDAITKNVVNIAGEKPVSYTVKADALPGLLNFVSNNGDVLEDHDGPDGSGTEEEDLARELPGLLRIITNFDTSGNLAPKELTTIRTEILNALNAIDNHTKDDVAATFMFMVHELMGDNGQLFNLLLADSSFAQEIWNIIDDGDADPDDVNSGQLQSWFIGAGYGHINGPGKSMHDP